MKNKILFEIGLDAWKNKNTIDVRFYDLDNIEIKGSKYTMEFDSEKECLQKGIELIQQRLKEEK